MTTRAFFRALVSAAPAAALLATASISWAGVTNPNISVIGQPFIRMTDDASDPDHDHWRLDAGETEFAFDAALNPYANGAFIASLANGGIELEEGYFTLVRGLPWSLALKGGKYRAGFGRLNPAHPHAYPFAERPHVLAAYLPGDESLNDTGVSVSRLFALGDNLSLTASADWLQGDEFHPAMFPNGDSLGNPVDDRNVETRPAFLGRVSGFTMLGDQSALEFGVSGLRGTNNVPQGLHTTVLGADAKAKLWTSPRAYVVIQAEALRLKKEEPETLCLECSDRPLSNDADYGGYVFADYNFALRYNVGASYERFQQHAYQQPTAQAVGLFAGLALLEETTAFRADWNHFKAEDSDPINTFTLRVIYSMGPHKAHQF